MRRSVPPGVITCRDLAAELDISKATAHRYLQDISRVPKGRRQAFFLALFRAVEAAAIRLGVHRAIDAMRGGSG